MSKQDILMKSILKFYENEDNFSTFLQFVQKKSDTALRTLDWFATNYTKYRKVNINGIDIQSDYRQQLKAYQKEYFDPFKRKTRIQITWKYIDSKREFKWKKIENLKKIKETKHSIITTIGQLNFFKWAIQRNILNFILDNSDDIQKSQNKFSKNKRQNKTKGTIIKPNTVVHKTVQRIVIDFN